jgi:putrescine importer
VQTPSTEPVKEPEGRSTGQLKPNAIGLVGSMMVGVVILSPAIGIYFAWGLMVPNVGNATAIIFAIALLMTLPTAYSYALINSRMPSAGASYKWASSLISPQVGISTGLCTTLFYAFIIPINLPFIALLATDLLRSSSTTLFAAIMAGTLLLAVPLVYRGITFAVDLAIFLVGAECVILVAIAIGALVSGDGHVSLAPLNPGNIPSGALIPALVLGVLSFTGYDAVSTVAEETRLARRLIPRATILSVVVVGVFWLVLATILSDALPPATYAAAIEQGGLPLPVAADSAFGSAGRDIVDIMGIEASFGLLVAGSIGSTRLLYAMGRDGVISPRFASLHPRFKVPWMGVSVALAFAAAVDVLLSIYLGVGFEITLWLANIGVFFALVTYLVINVCNPLLFVRHFRSEFHWFANGVVPLAGVAVVGYFLYKGFFEALWNADFKMGQSVVITAVALLGSTVVAAWALARRAGASEAARGMLTDRADLADHMTEVEELSV